MHITLGVRVLHSFMGEKRAEQRNAVSYSYPSSQKWCWNLSLDITEIGEEKGRYSLEVCEASGKIFTLVNKDFVPEMCGEVTTPSTPYMQPQVIQRYMASVAPHSPTPPHPPASGVFLVSLREEAASEHSVQMDHAAVPKPKGERSTVDLQTKGRCTSHRDTSRRDTSRLL